MGAVYLCLMSVLLPAAHAAADSGPPKIKPLISWMGNDSKQSKPLYLRCEGDEAWFAAWERHQGKETSGPPWCPQVNFDTCLVVTLFGGNGSSHLGIMIREITEEEQCVRLRFWPMTQQTASGNFAPDLGGKKAETLPKKVETCAFAFVVLPRTAKAVVVEEMTFPNNRLDEPVVWKERARLTAGKK